MISKVFTDRIFDKITELKIIPPVAFKIVQLISNEKTSMNDFETLIGYDPVLTARLLKHINSPVYNLKEKVGSINRASFFVGLKKLRTVVCNALRHTYQNEIVENGYLKKRLWLHSAAVGLCAQLIYKRILSNEGEEGLVAGLVHDIGIIVVTQVLEETYSNDIVDFKKGFSSIFECDESEIKTVHCIVGEFIARKWNFPENTIKAISEHHSTSADIISLKNLYEVVTVAHYIVESLGYTEVPKSYEKNNDMTVEHIATNGRDYRLLIKELVSEIEKAKIFYEVIQK